MYFCRGYLIIHPTKKIRNPSARLFRRHGDAVTGSSREIPRVPSLETREDRSLAVVSATKCIGLQRRTRNIKGPGNFPGTLSDGRKSFNFPINIPGEPRTDDSVLHVYLAYLRRYGHRKFLLLRSVTPSGTLYISDLLITSPRGLFK